MQSLTIRLLAVYFVAVVVIQAQDSKLTNQEIAEMHCAGLSSDLILEKILTSTFSFDTSPAALEDLKNAGIADSVIFAMMGRASGGFAPIKSEGFHILPVASDNVLDYGNDAAHIQHVPYNDMLSVVEREFDDALTTTGARNAVQIPKRACCQIKIELLQAQSVITFGSTVNVVLRVTLDGTGFSKVFQGDGSRRTMAGPWRSWQEGFNMRLKEATADLIKAVVADPEFMRLLLSTTG